MFSKEERIYRYRSYEMIISKVPENQMEMHAKQMSLMHYNDKNKVLMKKFKEELKAQIIKKYPILKVDQDYDLNNSEWNIDD